MASYDTSKTEWDIGEYRKEITIDDIEEALEGFEPLDDIKPFYYLNFLKGILLFPEGENIRSINILLIEEDSDSDIL